MAELRWDPPGPGVWWFEWAHHPRPVSRLFASIRPIVNQGFARGMATYGGAIPGGWTVLNDYVYVCAGERGPLDQAEFDRACNERRWAAEATRWYEHERPAAVARNRALQAIDVAALDDRGLGQHVESCLANHNETAPLHFEHRGREIVLRLFVAHAESLGLSEADTFALFTGCSVATSEPTRLIGRIAQALAQTGIADVASLEDIRAVPAARAALDAYMAEYGCRVLDAYEVATPTLEECPELVVASVNAALAAGPSSRAPGPTAPPTPEGFDEALLADARLLYPVRDDDNAICIVWPLGLLRRAVLEAGRRLMAAGRLVAPEDLFEATADELLAVLDGGGPSAGELAERAEARRYHATLTPPALIGDPFELDEPLPGLVGTGIGTRRQRGRARVVDADMAALSTIEPGDVLIARQTGPAFNAVFPILGAVAVEEGWVDSHTAILAREFGLPAVIGVHDLLGQLNDGDEVEVDPIAGTITRLGPGPDPVSVEA